MATETQATDETEHSHPCGVCGEQGDVHRLNGGFICDECVTLAKDPLAKLPDAVREIAAPADEWGHRDPTKSEGVECDTCGQEMWEVYYEEGETCGHCGGEWCFATPDGDPLHGEYCGDPAAAPYNMALEDDDTDAIGLICEGCNEELGWRHEKTLTVAGYEFSWWEMDSVVYDLGAVTREYDCFSFPDRDAPDGLSSAMYDYLRGEIDKHELAERLGADPDDPTRRARGDAR